MNELFVFIVCLLMLSLSCCNNCCLLYIKFNGSNDYSDRPASTANHAETPSKSPATPVKQFNSCKQPPWPAGYHKQWHLVSLNHQSIGSGAEKAPRRVDNVKQWDQFASCTLIQLLHSQCVLYDCAEVSLAPVKQRDI